jgi:hypothetical protein
MPVAKIRGVNIFYQVIGDRGPWVALITGGRRGHDEFVPLATKLADAGDRVVLQMERGSIRPPPGRGRQPLQQADGPLVSYCS